MHPNDTRGQDYTGSRSFKRYSRKAMAAAGYNTCLDDAYLWGSMQPNRRNPYPPGRRHAQFEEGRKYRPGDLW